MLRIILFSGCTAGHRPGAGQASAGDRLLAETDPAGKGAAARDLICAARDLADKPELFRKTASALE